MLPPGYMDLVRKRESGGNNNASNPLSSSSGLYGFTDGTFVNTMAPLMPGKSREEILALKSIPAYQHQAAEVFSLNNANTLKNAGIDPTAQNLYLAHHFGAGGATKLLKADPNTPLNQIFGPEVFKANPYMNNIADAQGLINKWSGGGGGNMNNQMQGGSQTTIPGEEQGFSLSNFFGNNLVNAGAALAAINSPAAAAAIGKLAQSSDQDFQTSVNQQTGQVVRVNKRTGAVQVMDAPALRQAQQAQIAQNMQDELGMYERKKEIDKRYATGPKISDGLRKMQMKDFNEATEYARLTDDMADIRSAIQNKEIDYNLFNQYKNTAFSIMGLSPEKKAELGLTPRAVEIFQKFERLKNATALEEGMKQAGVETDRDFLNALKANFGSNNFDGQNVDIALRDLIKKSGRLATNAARLYEARSNQYGQDAEMADPYRRETVLTSRERAMRNLEAAEQTQPFGTPSSGNKPQPQQGGPVRITTEAEFKNLQPGTLFIGPDGKTYRK